jgi:mono/diheme cytochrome c family protein
MKARILIGVLATTVAVGCSKKKPEEGKEPAVAVTPPPVGSGSAGSGSAGSGSAVAEVPTPDPKLVARGEYLSKMFGCPVCHMGFGEKGPDFSKPFSGGLEIPEAFGTWRGPNITPHKGSGIGNWKVEDVMVAVREGVRPDGSHLYPIMPYPNYNRMTDDDARAVATYLLQVPAIDHVVAPNKDLKMPQIPVPKPENKPDPVDDPVKHGEYLVTIMHCNNCHAAPGKDGVPDFQGHPFSGGQVMELAMLGEGKLQTPNITSDKDTGIGKWTDADIIKSLKTMTRPDGTIIQGPMQFYQAGWATLEDKDLAAIAAFIKTIPAEKKKVPKSTFKPRPMAPPPGAGSGSAAAGPGSAAGSGAGSAGSAAAAGSAASGSAAGSAAK